MSSECHGVDRNLLSSNIFTLTISFSLYHVEQYSIKDTDLMIFTFGVRFHG